MQNFSIKYAHFIFDDIMIFLQYRMIFICMMFGSKIEYLKYNGIKCVDAGAEKSYHLICVAFYSERQSEAQTSILTNMPHPHFY